jgi:hypothetical protein
MNGCFLFAILILVALASLTLACERRLTWDPNNPPAGPAPETITHNIETSLHGTSRGMQFWYDHPDGFGAVSGVPYSTAGCASCHVSNCKDCHEGEGPRAIATCTKCHARQGLEMNALQLTDVHLEAGMVCADCHEPSEVHGDGNVYANMVEAAPIRKDCIDCHTEVPDNTAHQIHSEKLDCAACHVETMVTCYNCHFESLLNDHEKRPYGPFSGFTILANSTVDQKVRPVTYQSVTYGEHTFVAFGPYHGHSVMQKGHDCSYCHSSARIDELNETGMIKMTEWREDAGTLTHTVGMIPFVPDKFEFQFMTYDTETKTWKPTTTEAEKMQWLYIEPLTTEQLTKLGYEGD